MVEAAIGEASRDDAAAAVNYLKALHEDVEMTGAEVGPSAPE